MRNRTVLAVAACAAVAAACGGGASAPAIADECNPLGGEGCLLPWPSAAYLAADPSSPATSSA